MADQKFTPQGGSFKNTVDIVTSNTTIYAPRLQALYVGTIGDLVIKDGNNQTRTYKNAEGWFFIEVRQVLEATTAEDVVGHY